ncbi:retrovirus-related Pol polyprotein from transposon TNT 1-94 [Trichonephila clavipes]|nr:retrovirus-related Pol polyprotein from transposon TNT 1-94 [Trichonephila clavipes]
MLERVIENWTSRLDYIRASRGSPMPEIIFKIYPIRAERFLNNKVLNVRIDNGLEFIHKEFLDSQGIEMERTNTYSPEMNGVSERFNNTALDAIRAMLRRSGLSNKFWSEALPIRGMAFVKRQKPPFELYCGKQPLVVRLMGVRESYRNLSFNESVSGEAVLGLNNKSALITEESESETEISEGDEIPCENLAWIRKALPRPDGTKGDIYYGFEGSSLRLRSYPDVEKYCRPHNIKFNKNFFNFSGKDKYSGPVPKGESSTNHEAHHVPVVISQNFKEASLSPD